MTAQPVPDFDTLAPDDPDAWDPPPRPAPLPSAFELEAARRALDAEGGALWENATPEQRARLAYDAAESRAARAAEAARPTDLEALEAFAAATPRAPFPEPEDRGAAVLSDLGTTEYVEDLIRPGRIVVWAAEEGAGKSYTVDGELGVRLAVAGGSLAGTWPVVATGPVLVLSEMHADDDYAREATILGALGLERPALAGRYYRLPLMTAAGGPPVLTVPAWREWVTGWLRDRGALLLIVDTATGATQIDPWGQAIQAVYRDLRAMLDAYPRLAVVLVLHLKKPQGRGDRRISDVLGEWGRWCDVVVVQEADGTARTKLSTHKRVRRQRRIVATRADGLLVDPVDMDAAKATKVPREALVSLVAQRPGLTYAELGAALGVSKDTASNYVRAAEEAGELVTVRGPARSGRLAGARVYAPDARPAAGEDRRTPNIAEHARIGDGSAMGTADRDGASPNAEHLYRGSAMLRSAMAPDPARPAAGPVADVAVVAGHPGDAPVCECGRPKVRTPGGQYVCTNAPGHPRAASAAAVRCDDYEGHRFRHRLVGDRWSCAVCEVAS